MNALNNIISLLSIGAISYCFGRVAEKLKLPSLIGMMISGMIIGPVFLNIVPNQTLNMAPAIKDIALIIVLFVGGLGISLNQMKQIGRPAILLSSVPAILEGITIAIVSMLLLDFSFVQGGILGFIVAAVSPAVLIPSMVELINKKIGQDKAIPQMLLVGASADDTISITLFTTFLAIYSSSTSSINFSIIREIINIPIIIIVSIVAGWLLAKVTKNIILTIKSNLGRVIFLLIICFLVRSIESKLDINIFNSLIMIMVYGFFLRTYLDEKAKRIQNGINLIWNYGKLYLFAFVGMAIDPTLIGQYFLIGIIILVISLTIRSIGVLISLAGTDLNFKERIFCVIAYLPKATVQSAKAGIPLQAGVIGGEIMQAIAILSVLITAPIGAIGIKLTSTKFLNIEFIEED